MTKEMNVRRTDGGTACSNRERLARAGVIAVNVIGGPGCGKTSLIATTAGGLRPGLRVGVVRADAFDAGRADARLAALGVQTSRVDPDAAQALTPRGFAAALDRLDLGALDVLLIENVSSLAGPAAVDLGEAVKVAVFSVAAGAQEPAKYPGAVRSASAIVLNKVDLRAMTHFNPHAFWASVRRTNSAADEFEMSTLNADGIDQWVDWLRQRLPMRARLPLPRSAQLARP